MEQENVKQNQNIDDLYLNKRKKKKFITYIVSLAVAVALAMVIIIMACVKVDLRPSFVKNPDEVTIYSSELVSGSALLDDGTEGYKDFTKIYNNMFNISSLSALFTGNFGNYKINETVDNFDESTSALVDRLGKNYVKLFFDEPQKFYNKNGKEYSSIYGGGSYQLTFDTVYFSFDNDNIVKDMTFYFVVKGNRGFDSQGNARKSVTTVSLRGNTQQIYKSLDNFRELASN